MNKKVGNLVLSLLLSLVMMIGVTQMTWAAGANPTDVPSSHWAYKAVKLLIDKGYLQLYQDHTFQGDKPVDRYTLATVVAKILNEITVGNVGTNRQDVDVLRKLIAEFRDELIEITAKTNLLIQRTDDLNKQTVVIKEDLTKTTAQVQNLTAEQQELQKEVQQMVSDIIELKNKVKQLEQENAQLKADIERMKAENEATRKRQNTYIGLAIVLGLLGIAR